MLYFLREKNQYFSNFFYISETQFLAPKTDIKADMAVMKKG